MRDGERVHPHAPAPPCPREARWHVARRGEDAQVLYANFLPSPSVSGPSGAKACSCGCNPWKRVTLLIPLPRWGSGVFTTPFSTGCASLYPQLHPRAPSGRKVHAPFYVVLLNLSIFLSSLRTSATSAVHIFARSFPSQWSSVARSLSRFGRDGHFLSFLLQLQNLTVGGRSSGAVGNGRWQ